MPIRPLRTMICLILLAGSAAATSLDDRSELARQVEAAERAFARSMAERDFEAFRAFLSEEAVFMEGTTAWRGKQAVAEHWAVFFTDPEAPFSWAPETVEVLDSGKLAFSTGPVYGSEGNRFGTYNSIWRLEEPGVWRIVFDRGGKFCE